MRRFRFHIGTISILILALGVGFAALRKSDDAWDSSMFSLTLGVLFVEDWSLAPRRRCRTLGRSAFPIPPVQEPRENVGTVQLTDRDQIR
jgi:hypothetical protein